MVVGVLIVANLSVWTVVYAGRERGTLRVYFLDVGQGDSILIDSPTRGRVLIDGGPTRKVLSELGKVLPFGDKRIDVVIETHPDADHITGLVDVLERFKVGAFLEPGVESKNIIDDKIREIVREKGITKLIARRGLEIDLGGDVLFTVLYPDTDVSGWETNNASIVSKLVYKNKSFLLTGDAPKASEYKMIALNESLLDVDVLQVGHHGSDTSTSLLFAKDVSPEIAVISVGKNNRYGHPHKATLGTLESVGARILQTAKEGTIMIETDGESLKVK